MDEPTVVLSPKETRALRLWLHRHRKCNLRCTDANASMGMKITLTQTGIGVGITATCGDCGRLDDITDYSRW